MGQSAVNFAGRVFDRWRSERQRFQLPIPSKSGSVCCPPKIYQSALNLVRLAVGPSIRATTPKCTERFDLVLPQFVRCLSAADGGILDGLESRHVDRSVLRGIRFGAGDFRDNVDPPQKRRRSARIRIRSGSVGRRHHGGSGCERPASDVQPPKDKNRLGSRLEWRVRQLRVLSPISSDQHGVLAQSGICRSQVQRLAELRGEFSRILGAQLGGSRTIGSSSFRQAGRGRRR